MVAVLAGGPPWSALRPPVPVTVGGPVRGRLVAVAVTPGELRRPGSDLARLAAGVGQVDLLTACDGTPCREESVLRSYLDYPDYGDCPDYDDPDTDDTGGPPAPDAEAADDVVATAGPELAQLRLHRLGLHAPLGPRFEPDLVAALCELVGFDPEPGVYCLAPLPTPDDPNQATVARAAERVAQVYGLPMLRYHCLELSAVGVPA